MARLLLERALRAETARIAMKNTSKSRLQTVTLETWDLRMASIIVLPSMLDA